MSDHSEHPRDGGPQARGDPLEEAAIRQRFATIITLGDAEAYAQEVRTKARAARANRAAQPALPSRLGGS